MTSYTGVFMTSYTRFAGFRFQVEFTFGLYSRSLMCGSAPSSMSFCAFLFIFIFIFTFGSYGRSLMCGSAPSSMSFCATALWFRAAAWCSGVRPPAVYGIGFRV